VIAEEPMVNPMYAEGFTILADQLIVGVIVNGKTCKTWP
jgi:hypothetical protein